jgi:hypothetical protein
MKDTYETNYTELDNFLEIISAKSNFEGSNSLFRIDKFDGQPNALLWEIELNGSSGRFIYLSMLNASDLTMASMSMKIISSGTTPVATIAIDAGNDGIIDFTKAAIKTWTTVTFNVTLFNNITLINNASARTSQVVIIPFNISVTAGSNISIKDINFKRTSVYSPRELAIDLAGDSYIDIDLPGAISSSGSFGANEASASVNLTILNPYDVDKVILSTIEYALPYDIDSGDLNLSDFYSVLKTFNVPCYTRVETFSFSPNYITTEYFEDFKDLSKLDISETSAEILDGIARSVGTDSKIQGEEALQIDNITAVLLSGKYYNLSHVDVSFYVSNNNGTSWEHADVPNDGGNTYLSHTFTSSGNQLKWRADFNATSSYTSGDYGYVWTFYSGPQSGTNFSYDITRTLTPFEMTEWDNYTVDVGNDGHIDYIMSNRTEMSAAKTITAAFNAYLGNCTASDKMLDIPVNFTLPGPGRHILSSLTVYYNLSNVIIPYQPFNHYLWNKNTTADTIAAFNDSSAEILLDDSEITWIQIPRKVLITTLNLSLRGAYS